MGNFLSNSNMHTNGNEWNCPGIVMERFRGSKVPCLKDSVIEDPLIERYHDRKVSG